MWKPAEDNFTSYVEQGQENKTDLYAELRFLHAGDYRIGCRTDKVSDYDSHYVTFPQNMIGEDGYVDLEGLGIKGMVMDVKNLNLTQTGFAIRIAGDTHSSLGDTKDHLLWQTSIASGFQIKLLYGSPVARQAADLMKSVRLDGKLRLFTRELTQAYTAGDLERLHALMNDPETGMTPEEAETLINSRNHAWVSFMIGALTTAPMFIAVGAGHLPGPNGLINLLRSKGYTVEPAENSITR